RACGDDFSDIAISSYRGWSASAESSAEDLREDHAVLHCREKRQEQHAEGTSSRQLLISTYEAAVQDGVFPALKDNLLDLHRYTRQLAVFAVWYILSTQGFFAGASSTCKNIGRKNVDTAPSSSEVLTFIVGRGLHSEDGTAHLGPAVVRLLDEFSDVLEWNFPNPGRISVSRKRKSRDHCEITTRTDDST
ncbi:unnamed protein product, partial [Amoebophrya sp. A120]